MISSQEFSGFFLVVVVFGGRWGWLGLWKKTGALKWVRDLLDYRNYVANCSNEFEKNRIK